MSRTEEVVILVAGADLVFCRGTLQSGHLRGGIFKPFSVFTDEMLTQAERLRTVVILEEGEERKPAPRLLTRDGAGLERLELEVGENLGNIDPKSAPTYVLDAGYWIEILADEGSSIDQIFYLVKDQLGLGNGFTPGTLMLRYEARNGIHRVFAGISRKSVS